MLNYLMIIVSGLAMFSGCSSVAVKTHDVHACSIVPKFQNIVEEEIDLDRLSQVGFKLSIYKKQTGSLICDDGINVNTSIYPASSIKTLIAFSVLRKIDLGSIHFDDELTINQSNAGAECHHWDCQLYGPGQKQKVSTLLLDMVTVSNNIATNQLIEAVGKSFINETAHLLGSDALKVSRKLYEDVNPEPEIKNRNAASASALNELYREISTGRLHLLSEKNRNFLINLLAQQKYNNRLSASFPKNILYFHKTGTTSDSSSDGGFFYLGDDTVVVLVGLQGFQDKVSLQKIGKRVINLVLDLQ